MRQKAWWIVAGAVLVLLMAASGWLMGTMGAGHGQGELAATPAATAEGGPVPPDAKHEGAVAKADAAYRSSLLQAKQEYARDLSSPQS